MEKVIILSHLIIQILNKYFSPCKNLKATMMFFRKSLDYRITTKFIIISAGIDKVLTDDQYYVYK